MTPMLRREANQTFRRTLARAIITPVALFLVLVAIFLWLVANLLSATAWVEHTDTVIARGYELQATMIDQETGLRGFLLTNDQQFLEPYTSAVRSVDIQFDQLADLVRDNPQQAARIAQLRTLNGVWQQYARDVLSQDQSGAQELVASGRGKQLTDQMRILNAQFIRVETSLRTIRTQSAQRTTESVLLGSIGGTLVLGALLAFTTRRMLFATSTTYNTALTHAEANEQELYTQREWFQSMLSGIGDAVIATDARGLIDFMNPVAETLTGWTSDQAHGKPVSDVFTIINEHSREPVEVPVERVLHEGVVVGLANHTALVRRDGTMVPIDDSAAPVRDRNGVLVGAVLVFRDISARHSAEAELRSSEQRYRNLAESLPIALYTTDAAGTVDYYNSQWLTYTGLSLEDVQGPKRARLIHADDSAGANEQWQQSLATGTVYEHEYRRLRYDGTYRWQLGRAIPIRDQHGQIIQWIGTATDIDDQKRAEQEARESETQFRRITESMPQLVWTTLPDGYHTYFNQRWYDYTGTTLEQVRGNGWSNILHPDDYARTIDVWGHCLRTGEPYEIEYRFKQAATGEYKWFLGRAAAIRDGNNVISQWFGTCTDIDAQKRGEETLRERTTALARATGSLEERNRELDQFAYVTSHDLKAPLRGIANLSQWIEEDLGEHATADIRKQLELLRGRVNRMEALIDGILQFSRIGRVRSTVEQVNLNQLLADVVDLLAPPADARITIEPLPPVRGDKLQLQQVFQNLVNNALKHGQRSDMQIEIGYNGTAAMHEFFVRDNGPGIAPQYHDKIFVIFQTLVSRDKVEGTGLGLSLVKKIVELHGGRVWVESDLGKGTTFRFTWPKAYIHKERA